MQSSGVGNCVNMLSLVKACRFPLLVLVTMRAPLDDLYQELVSDRETLAAVGIEAVHRIGDALSPRPIAESMFEGHRLAREFESPDPAVALPYKREPLRLVLENRPR